MPSKSYLSPSARRTLRGSDDEFFSSVPGREEIPEPDFDRDEIFIGWKRAQAKDYTSLKEAKFQEYGGLGSEVFRESLYVFQNRFGDRDLDDMDEMFIDQSSAAVTFKAGERGAGKSVLLRAEGNRSSKSGILTVYIDPAHEYWTNNKKTGIQNEFLRESAGLRRGEEPEPTPTEVLMPTCVFKARTEKSDVGVAGRKYVTKFQFSLNELDEQDFGFLFLNDVSKSQSEAKYKDFRSFVSKASELASKDELDNGIKDLEVLVERMDRNGSFSYSDRAGQIKDAFEPLKKWDVFGEDHSISSTSFGSWDSVVQDHNSVALVLADNDKIGDHTGIKSFLLGKLIKKFRSMRKSGVYDRPTHWVIDEVHRYVDDEDHSDREDSPPGQWEIRKAIKEDRKIGFRITMSSQEVKDIPAQNFLKQTDHMFIPMNLDTDDRRYLLNLYDLYQNADESRGKWKKIFSVMGEYEWFYMRKKTKDWKLLVPAAPLSNHLQE